MTGREAIAHHEAGHAVVAALLGAPFHRVYLEKSLNRGALEFAGTVSTWVRTEHRAAALSALAGAWAEAFARGLGPMALT